jgi:DNA primase
VAATERSLALLLEEGFEAKVLALPGGLDPDSFIRQQGSARYRELLGAAPSYLEYLTDRAVAANDVSTPEGKVRAANAVMPYLARVPNRLLQAELANQLAERLRLDQRLVQQELRRGAVRPETRLQPESAASKATPAEKELLRALIEDPGLADELLPHLMEQGMAEGLVTEPIIKRLLELRQRGENAEPAALEEPLSTDERRVLYESLFWPVRPSREQALGYIRALRLRKVQHERGQLLSEIQAAVRAHDDTRLVELQRAKLKVDRDLRELSRPEKNLTYKRTD